MDIKQIEIEFLSQFPNGFEDEYYINLTKKFNDKKAVDIISSSLSKTSLFEHIQNGTTVELLDDTNKLISSTWMTSRFEKIAFRNFNKVLDNHELFYTLLYDVMYGDINAAFDKFVELLKAYIYVDDCSNCAKWPIISAFVYYTRDDFFPIKPMTTKRIAKALDYDIKYNSKPNLTTFDAVNNMYLDFLNQSHIANNKQQADAILYFVFN